MADASGILAGKAFVQFGVDDAAVSPGLAKVEAKMRAFGSGAGEIGGRVGEHVGRAVMKGVVGFFGVQMADRILSGLADSMEQAANGEQFKGVGEIIGDSLREGIRSVPIAGEIERIAEAFGNKLWGVDPAVEEKIKSSREEAARNQERLREEEDRKAKERAEEAKRALTEANGLYSGWMADYAEQAGAIDPRARKIEEQATKLAALLTTAGMGGMANSAAAALRERAAWAAASEKSIADWKDRQRDIDGLVNRLQGAAAEYGLSEDELAMKKLRDLGASSDQMAQAQKAIDTRKLLEMMEDPRNSYDPGAVMQQAAQAIGLSDSASGSFSSRVLDDLAQSSPALAWQEKIAENTKRTANAVENMVNPVFGS